VLGMSGGFGSVYDRIGRGYAAGRRTDARWMEALEDALGDVRTVVNVAGAGSYESPHRQVLAVEPSTTMIAQRPPGAAPVVRGVAESLPFADGTFEAATAVLTVHHWQDLEAGLAELRRVARRAVVLTFDPPTRSTGSGSCATTSPTSPRWRRRATRAPTASRPRWARSRPGHCPCRAT
jgi:SAM-dependent methyltransferase